MSTPNTPSGEKPKSDYSLWLSPPDTSPEYESLHSLIKSLSVPDGSRPRFDPHLTLLPDSEIPEDLGEGEIVDRVSKVVGRWVAENRAGGEGGVVRVDFKEVRTGQHYFQCVLAVVKKQPSLLSLNSSLAKEFNSMADYFPHLSLVYGDLTPGERMDVIEGLIKDGSLVDLDGKVGEEGREEERGQGGCLVNGVGGFVAVEVLVVRTKGDSDDWRIVKRVPLS